MDGITWFVPSKNAGRSHKDVSVYIEPYKGKNGEEKKRTRIAFRNESFAKITHGDFICTGQSADRIWFKDGIASGFKLSKLNGRQRYIRIPANLDRFVVEYTLHMSGTGDMWYISKEEE